MTARDWPTREQWQADAEKSVRQACFASERVSDRLGAWTNEEERTQLAHIARNARLGLGRAIRAIEGGDPDRVRLQTISYELMQAHRILRTWADITERAGAAAEQAVEAAVAAEIERRTTDEAWAREQTRRAAIDGEWVLPARDV